jgi:broad specificity phosphatase PhoE
MRLILTRHGETEENKKNINQGWKPGHLSKLGIEQAKILAGILKNAKIDVIYTSDLSRCVKTASEISKYHPKTKYLEDKRLRERSTGIFEGTVIGKNDWDSLDGDLFNNKPKGGESFVEVWARINHFYEELLKKYDNETILIVGHGGSMCLLLGAIFHKDLEYSLSKIDKLKNTAFTELELHKDGSYEVILLNSEKHLKS